MNRLKNVIKKMYLEEIITSLFLLLVLILYLIFHHPLTLVTYFTVLFLPIILILFAFKAVIIYPIRVTRDKKSWQFLLKQELNFIRLIAPIIILLNIYSYLNFFIEKVNPRVMDSALIKIDSLLFFGHNPVLAMERFITPRLTEWFSFAYLSYFFYFPISFAALIISRKIREFHILYLTVIVIIVFGFIGYFTMPAIGPFYFEYHLFTKNLLGQSISSFNFKLINTYGYAKGTFPSLHAAMSLAFLLFAFKHQRKLFYIYLPFVISLLVSTIYLRQHYVVDLIAGLILCLFALYVSPKIYEWWEKKKSCPIFSTQAKKS